MAVITSSFVEGADTVFRTMRGSEIDDALLSACAQLFRNNYGIWGPQGPKPGARVSLSIAKMKDAGVLSAPEKTILATCTIGGTLVGHAFATTWECSRGIVGWVTQLVVDVRMRRRYIATHLLHQFEQDPVFQTCNVVGLVSSHPAACNALANFANVPIGMIDLQFVQQNAREILNCSTVKYLNKGEHLRGSLFEGSDNCDDGNGVVSSLFTDFFVDHEEPLAALKQYKEQSKWCLGELLGGHEYLIMLPRMSPADSV